MLPSMHHTVLVIPYNFSCIGWFTVFFLIISVLIAQANQKEKGYTWKIIDFFTKRSRLADMGKLSE